MNYLQINLGLNNNPFTAVEVIDYFNNHKDYDVIGYYIKDMIFNNQKEPTYVAMFRYKYTHDSKVLQDFENICSIFTQESIAIVTNKMQVLAFNVNCKGEPYYFDKNYFEFFKPL